MEPYLIFLRDVVWWEWIWGLVLNGFCLHLIRPLVVVLPLAIVFGRLGRGFGLPALFLRKSRYDRFFIGLGLGALIWQTLLAGYFFEAFATNYTYDRPPFCEIHPQPGRSTLIPADFAEVKDGEQPLRYTPADPLSVLRYAAIIAGVGAVVWLIVKWIVAVIRKIRSEKKTPEPPLPSANWILLGLLLGFGAASALAIPFLSGSKKAERPANPVPGFVYDAGKFLVKQAGWGEASARGKMLESKGNGDGVKARDDAVEHARKGLKPYFPLIGLFFLGFVVIMVINIGLTVSRALSPAAGLLTLLHIALALGTLLEYFVPSLLPLAIVTLLWLILFAGRYRLRFKALAPWYRGSKRIDLVKHYKAIQDLPLIQADEPNTPNEKFPLHHNQIASWNGQAKKPMVLICCSGGGSRAAAWTMRVLTELENRFDEKGIDFPAHVRLITGASGGIFGAAYYLATLPEPGKTRSPGKPTDLPKANSGEYPNLEQLNHSIRGDFLTPVVSKLVTTDIWNPFLPLSFPGDRGQAIEKAWSEQLGGWLDLNFDDLRDGEQKGWRPSLAVSPMLVEDGRQLVISNLSMRRAMRNLARKPGSNEELKLLSREGLEFFPLFGDEQKVARSKFPLSTAARMSCSFPWLFPASTLPTEPRRRVVDAGYYDNYGVSLGGSYLFTHLDWVKDNASKVVVIEIRDGLSRDEREMQSPMPEGKSRLERVFDEFLSPFDGLLASRSAGNTFRNDNLLHLLNRTFREAMPEVPFATTAFEFPGGGDVSLNFCLSDEEKQLIDGKMGIHHEDIEERFKMLLEWWK